MSLDFIRIESYMSACNLFVVIFHSLELIWVLEISRTFSSSKSKRNSSKKKKEHLSFVNNSIRGPLLNLLTLIVVLGLQLSQKSKSLNHLTWFLWACKLISRNLQLFFEKCRNYGRSARNITFVVLTWELR